MLANKDSSSKKDTKRGYFFSLFYVTLFSFSFLSGTMLSIPSSLQMPVSLGVQDVYAQEYKDQKDYDYDKSYGGGDSYYSNSYDKSYDSYDKKKVVAELEKFDNKLFVCDNGIVVDDRINCPQKCPFNTPLEGVYVMDLDVCNIQPGVGVTCPENTDLPGVVVTNVSQCNIFFECDATTPLGVSLQGQDVKVADPALCQLSSIPNLQVCESGPFAGFVVTEEDVCDAMEGVQVCLPGTDLQGMLTTNPLTCNQFFECDATTPLGVALGGQDVTVKDEALCQLTIPPEVEVEQCPEGTLNEFAIVTDLTFCDAPGDANICGDTTDLPGVYVDDNPADCEIFDECVTSDPIFGLISDTPGGDSPFQVVDEQICQIGSALDDGDGDGITLETCPPGSQLAGVQVTDLALCNLVTVDLKQCNACLGLVIDLLGTLELDEEIDFDLEAVITGLINLGTENLCALDDTELLTAVIEILIAAGLDPLDGDELEIIVQVVTQLANCLDITVDADLIIDIIEDILGVVIPTVTPSTAENNDNAQIQSNSTQSSQNAKLTTQDAKLTSQNAKITNQNVEINKAMEQQKMNPVLPLFNFNTP